MEIGLPQTPRQTTLLLALKLTTVEIDGLENYSRGEVSVSPAHKNDLIALAP